MRLARNGLSWLTLAVMAASGCGRGVKAPPEQGHKADEGSPPPNDSDGAVDPVVDCKKPIAQVADNTACSVTDGSDGLLLHAHIIAPSALYKGGLVRISADGMIACVGCDCPPPNGAETARVFECPDSVVSAGLINDHDHLSYAELGPKAHTERFDQRHDWRIGKRGDQKIPAASARGDPPLQLGELRFVFSGATSTIASAATDHFLRNLDDSHMEGLGKAPVQYETFPLGDTDGTQLDGSCAYPGFRAPAPGHSAWFAHISEGIDAEAHNEFLCLSATNNGGHALVDGQTAVVHGVALTLEDGMWLAARKTSLVWSPRSNVDLYGYTANVTLMDRLGVNIALGTDWMPSGSMNMSRELACADRLNETQYGKYFSNKKIVDMVTINAARAAHMDDVLGSLAAGKVADIAMFAGASRGYRAVIESEPKTVQLVLRAGKVLYGDDKLVAALALPTDCETLDVCGTPKRVCVQRELGTTFAALTAAAAHAYPPFACGEPTNEPSCIPFRNNEDGDGIVFAGLSQVEDLDGDGVPNATDSCPDVFNAPRPMDDLGGMRAQPDFDHDGTGDVCDVCPIDADTTTCVGRPDDIDVDHDDIANADDNCPQVANTDQADQDGDGKGDACDLCPQMANPGEMACSVTKLLLVEVLVKPLGDAPDQEWVKIYNPGTVPVALDGYQIAFGGAANFTGPGSGRVTLTGSVGARECVLMHEAASSAANGSPQIATAPAGFAAPQVIHFPGAFGLQQASASAPDAVALYALADPSKPVDIVVYERATPGTIASDFIGTDGNKANVMVFATDALEGKSMVRPTATTWAVNTGMTPNLCPTF